MSEEGQYEVVKFANFGDKVVYLTLMKDVGKDDLEKLKQKLISGDKDYDFCFLNCSYLISREFIFNGIHKAILNYENHDNKAKTLNTEIVLNMSPVNNIMDSLKRFGIDSSKDKDNLLCIKVADAKDDLQTIDDHISTMLATERTIVTDEFLFNGLDIAKFKKHFKLNDAKLGSENLQGQLTRLAIGTCLLRGN